MNTKIVCNVVRALAAATLLFAGLAFYYYSKNGVDNEIEFLLSIMVSAQFLVGGALLAFLPYERIN